MGAMRACDADDQARCRKNPVIGPQNGRPEPAKAINGMTFRMFCEANHLLLPFAPALRTAMTGILGSGNSPPCASPEGNIMRQPDAETRRTSSHPVQRRI